MGVQEGEYTASAGISMSLLPAPAAVESHDPLYTSCRKRSDLPVTHLPLHTLVQMRLRRTHASRMARCRCGTHRRSVLAYGCLAALMR